jgi:hypothetical protein
MAEVSEARCLMEIWTLSENSARDVPLELLDVKFQAQLFPYSRLSVT